MIGHVILEREVAADWWQPAGTWAEIIYTPPEERRKATSSVSSLFLEKTNQIQ